MSEKNQENINVPFYKKAVFWFIFLYFSFITIYTIIFIYTQYKYLVPLTSNELGDFLAGVFAPLAFLFLYLGYVQQGKAIKQANDNIRKQLDQQGRMLALQEQERKRQEQATQPNIKLEIKTRNAPELIYDGSNFVPKPDSDGVSFEFIIRNTGEKISSVVISLTGDISHMLTIQSSIGIDQEINTEYLITKSGLEACNTIINFDFNIHYRTSLGIIYLRKYNVLYNKKVGAISYCYDADYEKVTED